jgi:hypothetical protein
MSTQSNTLTFGETIHFLNLTGHTLNDSWSWDLITTIDNMMKLDGSSKSITFPTLSGGTERILSVGTQGQIGTASSDLLSSIAPFLKNKTLEGSTNVININQSIFNPSDLTIATSSQFIVEINADYYILGDLFNNGILQVDGTLKVGGLIYNTGAIIGTGIIE